MSDHLPTQRSLLKGLVAGALAGLAATAAKSVAEKFYPPRVHGEPEPPEVLAEKVAGHALAPGTKAAASEVIHWGFGAAAGAFLRCVGGVLSGCQREERCDLWADVDEPYA